MQLTDELLSWALQLGGLSVLRTTYGPAGPGVTTLLMCSWFRVEFSTARRARRLFATTSLEVGPKGAAFVEAWLLALSHPKVQDVPGLAGATRVAFQGYRVEPDAAPAVEAFDFLYIS